MSSGENIYFFLIGVAVMAVILLAWLVFRKRKKWAVALTALLVIGYVGYYVSYPAIKAHTHAARYEQVTEYLATTYPDREFNVSPEDYEDGYNVGEFHVNDTKTPTLGVILRVDDDGQVSQTASWSNQDFPTRQDLWRELEFFYGSSYTLDKELPEIIKQDEWHEGELTAFALTINSRLAIALFNYDDGGYELREIKEGEGEGLISVETVDHLYIYIADSYKEQRVTILKDNGEELTIDTAGHKGQLIIEKK